MSKIAHYLQEHLTGEVMFSADARDYFSKDSSIFNIPPAVIVYPRNENDIRKVARFSWQLAQRNRIFPITARGSGTDTTGGALGTGIIIVFPAHLHQILELDSKSGDLSVEAGTNFGKLQQALQTHGLFIPAYPSSIEYSTVGGAIANNVSGPKSHKYGPIVNFVKGLRVVLANGEIIDTQRLSKKELNKKLGLSSFEGEIYRLLDTLIEENRELIKRSKLNLTRNNSGYNIYDVKKDDGSFDLTPLIVGSQATLGIVTEVNFSSEKYTPDSTLMMISVDDLDNLQHISNELNKSKNWPCSIEVVNRGLLEAVGKINPNQLKNSLATPYPEYLLFVEYDISNDHHQKKAVKTLLKLVSRLGLEARVETEPELKQELVKILECSSTYLGNNDGLRKALPIIDDSVVPPNQLATLITEVTEIFKKVSLGDIAIWGHAGDGNIHIQPHLDLSQVGDRQKAFKLLNEYYDLVINLGGSISGEHNDGRLKTPYLKKLYGDEIYELMTKVKQIFDPLNILNPGVKFGTSEEEVKNLIGKDYNLANLYTYLPRT